jgi:hypothetical protein
VDRVEHCRKFAPNVEQPATTPFALDLMLPFLGASLQCQGREPLHYPRRLIRSV